MASFFKNFGRGILYVVAFPFIIAGIVLYGVFGLFVFIFQFGKLIFLFFTGRTLFSDFEEDIKAKAILQAEKPVEEVKPNNSLSLYPSDSPVYTTGGYKSPVFEEKKEPEIEPEPLPEKEWEDDAK